MECIHKSAVHEKFECTHDVSRLQFFSKNSFDKKFDIYFFQQNYTSRKLFKYFYL